MLKTPPENRRKTMVNTAAPLRILGIDPGFGRLGIAVVEKNPKDVLLFSECFETDASLSQSKRLFQIYEEIEKVILKWQPASLAIETLFFNKNITTGIKVAEARGVIVTLAEKHGLKICEYGPQEIKSAVSGYGKATKEQMISMIPKLVKMTQVIKHDDEYDAIGVALTCSAIERPHLKF